MSNKNVKNSWNQDMNLRSSWRQSAQHDIVLLVLPVLCLVCVIEKLAKKFLTLEARSWFCTMQRNVNFANFSRTHIFHFMPRELLKRNSPISITAWIKFNVSWERERVSNLARSITQWLTMRWQEKKVTNHSRVVLISCSVSIKSARGMHNLAKT